MDIEYPWKQKANVVPLIKVEDNVVPFIRLRPEDFVASIIEGINITDDQVNTILQDLRILLAYPNTSDQLKKYKQNLLLKMIALGQNSRFGRKPLSSATERAKWKLDLIITKLKSL